MGTSLKTSSRSLGLTGKEAHGAVDLARGFVEALRLSILECLENILGKPAVGALVDHFQIDQRAGNPAELHGVLNGVFGSGAVVLEKIAVKDLFRRLGLRYVEDRNSGFDFAEMIGEARARLGVPAR